MVELQPSKLITRVRFPPPAPNLVLKNTWAWQVTSGNNGLFAHIAQG